jgi:hypothetical protein
MTIETGDRMKTLITLNSLLSLFNGISFPFSVAEKRLRFTIDGDRMKSSSTLESGWEGRIEI